MSRFTVPVPDTRFLGANAQLLEHTQGFTGDLTVTAVPQLQENVEGDQGAGNGPDHDA